MKNEDGMGWVVVGTGGSSDHPEASATHHTVQWWRPDMQGKYLRVRSFSIESLGDRAAEIAAEELAKELNEEGRTPQDWNFVV